MSSTRFHWGCEICPRFSRACGNDTEEGFSSQGRCQTNKALVPPILFPKPRRAAFYLPKKSSYTSLPARILGALILAQSSIAGAIETRFTFPNIIASHLTSLGTVLPTLAPMRHAFILGLRYYINTHKRQHKGPTSIIAPASNPDCVEVEITVLGGL